MNSTPQWMGYQTEQSVHELYAGQGLDHVAQKIIEGSGALVGEAVTHLIGMGYMPLAKNIMARTGAKPVALSYQIRNSCFDGRIDPLVAVFLLYDGAGADEKRVRAHFKRQMENTNMKTVERQRTPLKDLLEEILDNAEEFSVDPKAEFVQYKRKTNLINLALSGYHCTRWGENERMFVVEKFSQWIDLNAAAGLDSVSYHACVGGRETDDYEKMLETIKNMSKTDKIDFFSKDSIATLKKITALGWDAQKNEGGSYAGAIKKAFSSGNYTLMHLVKGDRGEHFPVWDHLKTLGAQMAIPNKADRDLNPLAIALENGATGLFKSAATPGRYCKDGANLDWVDPKTGETLLHLGSTGKKMHTDTLMSIDGARWKNIINHKSKKGETALHLAVASMDTKLVGYLLQAGADVNLTNAKGKLPLETVRRTGPKAQKNLGVIADMIEQHGGSVVGQAKSAEEMLMAACAAVNAKMAAKLLDAGANLEHKDKHGRTPLLKALYSVRHMWNEDSMIKAQKNQRELVGELLKRGADATVADMDGNTSLHFACERFCEHLIKPLLKAGADPSALNKEGKNPMRMTQHWDYLVGCYKAGNRQDVSTMVNIVKHFMEHGCDMFTKDGKGELPFAPIRSIPEVEAQLAKQNLEQQIGSTGDNAVAKKTRRI